MRASRCLVALLFGLTGTALAVTHRHEPSRFDAKAIEPPGLVIATRGMPLAELSPADPLRAGWEAFGARHGGWAVTLDHRSGLPTLAHGAGVTWLDGTETDPLAAIEARARAFLAEHRLLLGDWGRQLVLDTQASGRMSETAWLLVFRQGVDGVPVDGARFDFHVVQNRMVAFGAERWARVNTPTTPRVAAAEASDALFKYLETAPSDVVAQGEPTLHLAPADPRGARAGEWTGVRSAGLTHALVWRFRFSAPGEDSQWAADVDALTGAVIALADETKYDRVKGGVFPITSTGVGYEGTEQPSIPMPFADYAIDGGTKQTASSAGLYGCQPGQAVTTTLFGPYVRISNVCGPVNETTVCGEDIDLQTGPGTNCEVPAGASAGNTRGARSAFHQVNRNAERARFWLPDNTWVRNPVTVNVNVNSTCNASWGGSLNMYRAGNGCRNTAELQGVLVHEWGHGMDQNDGGGYDNSSEAYADVIAAYDARISCIGPGFYENGSNCSGYGDTCLNCSGVRDIDWAKRTFNRPATPQDFLTNQCGSGDGPCGKETHCESYPAAEAMWDLATRDLPASGLDAATSWQIADRLWFQSRRGSGGNAYNCALPSSDGCGTGSWYHKLRVADDDDGNLNNGTPHAAAIFAAFARHNIACGTAADATNRNSTGCPALAAPSLSAAIDGAGLRLDWTPVAGASKYRVYRTDLGCSRAQVPIAEVAAPTTTFFDADAAEGVNVSYRVQAVGSNAACEGAVSACQTAALQPLAGRGEFTRGSFACGASITLRVVDGNAGAGPLEVLVWSDSEQAPERVVLTATGPGAATYTGSIAAGSGAPVHGDGALNFAAGDQLSIEYIDANDGTGARAVSVDTATADCSVTPATGVQVTDLTDASGIVRWTTVEPTTGRVEWGLTSALGNTVPDNALGSTHAATIAGLNECGRVFFRVVTIDRNGNQSTLTGPGGQPFAFNVGRIPGFFRDNFDATANWTREGEWQIDAPQGRGTSNPDPTAAFDGTKVLGHDLTGLGQRPGDYERSTTQRAFTPAINATGKSGLEIKFRRWLNVGTTATAAIDVRVNNGAWQQVWSYQSSFFPLRSSAWSLETVSLNGIGDNASNVQVAFRMAAGGSQTGASSWNVDRFIVRQASDPTGESCGACGGAPSFGGLAAAVDADPCTGASTVRLSWDAAPAWGTGASGTYAIWRDTVPNFTPTAANRLAAGVTGTAYDDTTAQDGVTYHYLVRAENNETCSTGPGNGGVVDGNTVYRSVTPVGSQSLPGAVAGLRIQPPVGVDLRLTWSAASGAASYEVRRSSVPQVGGFSPRTTGAAAAASLSGDAADGATWFYLVRGVNACSQAGP